jgi:aldehyde dehydrogenase (NAD+)
VAGPEEIDLAVSAATTAFKTGPWSTFTGAQRAKCLNKFADLLEEHASELAALDAMCMGAPIGIGKTLASISAGVFRCV